MKKILPILVSCFLIGCFLLSCSPLKIKNYVEVETSAGNFVIGLYEGTPAHRDNYIENVKSGVYEGTLLYSAVRNNDYSFGLKPGFEEKDVLTTNFLAQKTVKAEFNDKIIPKKGTIGMKRVVDNSNPDKKSDSYLFFIVQGSQKIDKRLINTSVALRNRDTYDKYVNRFLLLPENKNYKDSLDALNTKSTMKQYNSLYAELMQIVSLR